MANKAPLEDLNSAAGAAKLRDRWINELMTEVMTGRRFGTQMTAENLAQAEAVLPKVTLVDTGQPNKWQGGTPVIKLV